MKGLTWAWRGLITFAVYALLLGSFVWLDVRSPKLIFALLGIAFLISSLLWEVRGGALLGLLTPWLAIPFLPPGTASLLWILAFAVGAMGVGLMIGWVNRRERGKRPEPKRPKLYPEDVFRRALNPMLIVDPSGRVLERNERAVELLGAVKHISEVIHFDDLERARAEMERARTLGEASGLELRAVSWDKETIPVEIRMRRLTPDQNQIWVELHDLSDRVDLERKLWEAEARYRYLIEDAIDTLDTGIMLLDRDNQIIWANQTIGYLLNVDREEMIGADLKRVLLQARAQMDDEGTLHRIFEAGEECLVFTLQSGLDERIIEFRSTLIETERYRGGRIDHYIDLTEIKKLERELVEKTERLEESNKKLEEFSHVVSHDLKQPLRTIQAFTQFLIEDYEDRLDEQGLNHLKSLQRSSIRMKTLIDNLLKLSSIGTKREPLEPVDVSEVLGEVQEDLGALLEEVALAIPDELPVITANRTRTAELFANLISNAVKYNDKAEKRIEVGWEEKTGEYVFYVRDNGMGIEERYRERIFELFERLGPVDDPESTGAGLAICKRIVGELGGRIWVESEVGRGSTFYFSVPKRTRVMAEIHQRA
jgi:signal transduction histidine kinase